MRGRVDVRYDDALRGADLDLVDRFAQAVARRRHEGRVERARNRQRHEPLAAQLFCDTTGLGDSVGVSGDDNLARCVVVGDPHVAAGAQAGRVDLIVLEPEHRSHSAGSVLGRDLHGLAALGDEAHRVREIEGAGRGQRAVLAEAVPGVGRGFTTDSTDRVEHHHAQHEGGELGIAGLFELVGIGVQQQGLDVATRGVGCFGDKFPRRVIVPGCAHRRLL